MEAKLCPDGSYVGRGGPNCEFAACPTAPSTWRTYESKQQGFSIKYPPELTVQPVASSTTATGTLVVFKGGEQYKDFTIELSRIGTDKEGYVQKMITATIFDGSGEHPKSFDEFDSVAINNNTDNFFYYIRTGVFEGVLSLVYYYPTDRGIYAFNLVAHGVDWTSPEYDAEIDPIHLMLRQMLPTFKLTN